jgi:hypothetical protein
MSDSKSFWPAPRAFHTQQLQLRADAPGQPLLWIHGGEYRDARGNVVALGDVAVLDWAAQRWFVTNSLPSSAGDVSSSSESVAVPVPPPEDGFIDTFGHWTARAPASRHASVLSASGEHMWLHGGCAAAIDSTTTPLREIGEPIQDPLLWSLHLGARVGASEVRVANARSSEKFGQGLTQAQPGPLYDENGVRYRFNYFFVTFAHNTGWARGSTRLPLTDPALEATLLSSTGLSSGALLALNNSLVGVPRSNSSALPYWARDVPWATGLADRLQILLVSNFVAAGSEGSSSSQEGELLTLRGNPGYPLQTTTVPLEGALVSPIYMLQYSITEGSAYEVYVSFDGVNVPGSPFHVTLQAGPVSGENSGPAADDVPVPPLPDLDPTTGTFPSSLQRAGNMALPRPLVGGGLGLRRAIRTHTASFVLQLVDTYLNKIPNSAPTTGHQLLPLSLALVDPLTGAFRRNLSLETEFNYVNNNEQGTYTVTYLVPDEALFGLAITLAGARTRASNTASSSSSSSSSSSDSSDRFDRWARVEGIDPLELSSLQMIGMLCFSCFISLLCVCAFVYFVAHHWYYRTPHQRSRSLLFDALFTLGCLLGTGAILEQTNYTGGTRLGTLDQRAYIGSHNACQLHSLFIGAACVLVFGSLYAHVTRARYIMTSIRQSVTALQAPGTRPDLAIKLHADVSSFSFSASSPSAVQGMAPPLPHLPNVPSDFRILLPVLLLFLLELLFQAIWVAAEPMRPAIQVANDNFRSYVQCSSEHKRIWVYMSLGVKGVMCAWMVYRTSQGRSTRDPLNEPRRLTWVSFNAAFSALVATALVFPLDAQDSIKTAFVVSTFAVCWATGIMVCVVFLPRVVMIHRATTAAAAAAAAAASSSSALSLAPPTKKKEDIAFWYDKFILAVQEEEKEARARAEREEREAKGSQGIEQGGGAGGGGGVSGRPSSAAASSGPSVRPSSPSAQGGGVRGASSSSAAAAGTVRGKSSASNADANGPRKPRPMPKAMTPSQRAAMLAERQAANFDPVPPPPPEEPNASPSAAAAAGTADAPPSDSFSSVVPPPPSSTSPPPSIVLGSFVAAVNAPLVGSIEDPRWRMSSTTGADRIIH